MAIKEADLQHLLDQATTDLPGASMAAMKAALFDVFAEFFDETSIWQETIPISVLPATQEYTLTPAEGGQILRLVSVLDTNRIGQPAYLKADRATVVLQATYNSPMTFTATVVKTVAFPTAEHHVPVVPEIILSVYWVPILAGLKGTMMRHNGKSYTNLPLSGFHLQKFLDGKKVAATDAQRAFTHGGQLWAFPRSWTISGQRTSLSTAFPRA
jgi:hypothetical protein